MTTRNRQQQQHQEYLNELIDIVEAENITGYGGAIDGEGFLLWGSQKYFQSLNDPPSVEDLLERKTDGHDDLGLDLYFVDDEDQSIYLIQSKFRATSTTIRRQELDSFLSLPEKLMDNKTLAGISNRGVLQFALEFKDYISSEYDVRLVYLTTERETQPIKAAIKRWNESTLTLARSRPIGHIAEIVGVDELLTTYQDPHQTTTTRMQYVNCFVAEESGDNLRSVNAMITADELVKVFRQNRFGMFRLNPRGPLGNTNVNKEIRRTLADDVDRKRFYFLNNGLTAVCEAFSVNRETRELQIQNLQIVNGCQTTWNIYQHAYGGGELGDVKVNIKLIEIIAMAADVLSLNISQASNSQSQMKDWDFLFNEDKQTQLQDEFEKLEPPIFYELKRGEQKYISRRDMQKIRKTTIKDVAQAMWAFVGSPSEAKDRLRDIPRNYKAENSAYEKVFFEGVTAQHLRLPLEIHDRVKQEWKRSGDQDSTGQTYQNSGDARLHIVWLIGKMLLRAMEVDEYKAANINALNDVTNRIDIWFENAYRYASDAVNDTRAWYIRDDDDAPEQVTLRQLFRANRYYDRFATELDRVTRGRFDDIKKEILGD